MERTPKKQRTLQPANPPVRGDDVTTVLNNFIIPTLPPWPQLQDSPNFVIQNKEVSLCLHRSEIVHSSGAQLTAMLRRPCWPGWRATRGATCPAACC